MDVYKIVILIIISLFLAYVGLIVGGMTFSADAGCIIGFLLPSICLIADMHTQVIGKEKA